MFNHYRHPRQHGETFSGDILKYIFFKENCRISIQISLKFVPKGLINGGAPNKRQAITRTNADAVRWHMYATLGGNG